MSDKKEIELLVCKCKDCTHWEIGKDVLICKTCGLTLRTMILPEQAATRLSQVASTP